MFDRLYRHGRLAGIGLAAALLSACGGGSATAPDTEPFYLEQEEEWSLVWSDEFDGSAVDSGNWTFQLGDGTDYGLPEPGWGNGERQYYQPENSAVVDGALVITAREEAVGGLPYTSSRMRSNNKFDFQYGRVEIRAKAAPGQGLWSAIWMMPTDSPYGTWAASGEIDIMEVVNAGTENQGVFLAAHHGFQWPLNQIVTAPADVDDASDWHTYALEWSGEYLRWFVDGEHLRTVDKASYYSYYYKDTGAGFVLADDASAPFNQDFHLIVNLAVGGNGPGFVNPADVDDSQMEVDYIRVFECSYGLANGTGCNSNADRGLETPDAAEPFVDETVIFADGAPLLSWASGDRQLVARAGWDNEGAMVVVDDGEVININTSGTGNAVIAAEDGETFELNNFYGAGELKFDIYIDSSGTAPDSDILIKMDSGYPALGQVVLSVVDLPKNEWFTYSVQVRDLVENPGDSPLNLQKVANLLVVEPTAAASLKIDNVSLKCASPNRRGCGISGPKQVGDGSAVTVLDEIGLGGGFWDLGVGGSSTDTGFESYYQSGNNQVSWSNTGDSLLVNFASSSEFGVWFVQADEPGVDLSLYKDVGFLRFELKVPQETIDDGLNYKVENQYPDGTGDLSLNLEGVQADTWTSFEVPVAELLASVNAGQYTDPRPGEPLDIAAVQAAIVMWPAGDQGGKFFEIRNVRYENDPNSNVCPQPTAFGVAEFTSSFGGTVIEEGGVYTYPSTAEVWGGFANENANMYPMSFPYGGTITFNAAVPTGGDADVRFVFEFNPYPDVNPQYQTAVAQISGADVTQYTIDIPEQGDNTFSSFLLYLNTQDVGVQIANVSVQAAAPPCEEGNNDVVLDPAAFTEAFGGTFIDGDDYTYPSTAEVWGGFANLNADLYPLSFPYGATISFTGAVPSGEDADVRFVFEFNPYPDVNPQYQTSAVTVSGSSEVEYMIEVPSQGENTFSSFLMYLNTQDVAVTVKNVVITVKAEPTLNGEALAPAEFSEAFGGTFIEGDEYTYPSTAEVWGGFANMNADLYPLSFPYGGSITFTGAVASGGDADVRFVLEFNPYPDVNPQYQTSAITVSGADAAQYTIEVPEQGDNTFSSFLMYLNTQDVAVTVRDVVIFVNGPPPAQELGPADFSEAFGGTFIEGSVYTYPSTAEAWGGFANMNSDLYPLSFPSGAKITFNGAVGDGSAADVRFVFEFNPYPDVNPQYQTSAVTVSGTELQGYEIDVPTQGDNTFSSFLMYLNTQDVGVTVSNVVLIVYE